MFEIDSVRDRHEHYYFMRIFVMTFSIKAPLSFKTDLANFLSTFKEIAMSVPRVAV